jgi:anti-anti-sigma regulatory factor/HAMP domain-containing protein
MEMGMRRSLRTRLLATILAAIALLTLVNVLTSAWGVGRIRDRAISDSAEALQRQAERYLLRLAQERAFGASQTFGSVRQILVATNDYLRDSSTAGAQGQPLAWQTLPDGRRFFQGVTTVLVPADSRNPYLLKDMRTSQGLDYLLPGQAEAVPDVVRISFMTPAGALRTYPHVDIKGLPKSWAVTSDPGFQASLPENNPQRRIVWTGVHSTLGGADPVFSLALPIYQENDTFHGVVSAEVSVSRLERYLEQVQIERTGFAFLIDGQGRLITTTRGGQQQFLGRDMARDEYGKLDLATIAPTIGQAVAGMRAGYSELIKVELNNRPYLLAFAPISGVDWSLGLLAPLDEITAGTSATSARITNIAVDTRTVGLLASLAAVLLLGLAMSYVLRRQFVRPLTTLSSATKAIAEGDLQPIPVSSDDEIGQLARSFNSMSAALGASRAELTAANTQLERKVRERTSDLDMAVGRMEQLVGTQQELLRTLREVSTPIIPVIEGVLAAPLIGQIDDERAAHMTRDLLTRIERDRARTVLLDITGVPVIDTRVAQALLRVVSASRLLGAEVVLVGVAPEVAQTIVTLGLDLGDLRTAADLRSAIEQLLARRRGSRTSLPAQAARNNVAID